MHQLIVISNPGPVVQEAANINRMFAAGMALFHLRKPGYNETQVRALLDQIQREYYSRVALHQCHHLAESAGIKRLHFPEAIRLKQQTQTFVDLVASGHILSTAVHSSTGYNDLPGAFSYTFYGPFAPSISKPGYGVAAKQDSLDGVQKKNVALIALGGLHAGNIQEPLHAGFDGVALLGSIWTNGIPFDNFKQIQEIWHTAGLPY